ncbi:MAG: uroporphyrinogen decarboxylase family protein [Chloroflexota bacterium]
MDGRERFLAAIEHREPDRVAIHDHPWASTVQRWRREGLPAGVAPEDYFGYEMVRLRPDLSPRFAAEEIEESEEYVLERTPYGALRRQHRDRSTTPEIVEYPIHSREDWQKIKPRLAPAPERLDWPALRAQYDQARAAGRFVTFHAHFGYASLLEYIRTDELLMLLATEPEWIKEMYQVQLELVLWLAEEMRRGGIEYDGAFLNCDLGYRNATLFSPQMYKELQFPFDKQLFRWFRDRNTPVILHSDGRVKALIPYFLEGGISVLQPLEVKAGMDLVELKREYGRDLAFMGGIDVRAMADSDPRAIEEEIKRKFAAAMPGGGYIYHSDHSVPNDVSLSQYRRVIELARQYGEYK